MSKKYDMILDEIRETFGLTNNEFSTICPANDQPIKGGYNLHGQDKRRVFDLHLLAHSWKHAGLSVYTNQLHQPILDGQSLFDVLNKDKIDSDMVLFIGSRINLMTPSKKGRTFNDR